MLIGVMMLMVPGGMFVSPVLIVIAIIMRRKNKSKESPETPNSLLPLINITP